MKGKWKGKYWYAGNVPDVLKDQKTDFELTIEEYSNSKITGSISDNVETGGTKGVGKVTGTVKGNKIQFVKRMPVKSMILQDGTKIEEDKPHRPIYYRGTIDTKSGEIKGLFLFLYPFH